MLAAVILLLMQTLRGSTFRPHYPYDRDDWREHSLTSQQWAAYIESAKRIAAEPWKG